MEWSKRREVYSIWFEQKFKNKKRKVLSEKRKKIGIKLEKKIHHSTINSSEQRY